MATIPDSVKATLDAQWTGAGGAEPTYYVGEDYTYTSPPPEGEDYIWIISKDLDTSIKPVNDTYSTVTHTLPIIVNTATSGDRLMEISDEVQRILGTVAIAGANFQRVSTRDLAPPEYLMVHKELLVLTIITFLADSGTAYGAYTTTTFVTDVLTVNTSLTLGRTVTAILDEDDMASDDDGALVTQQSIKKYVDDNVTAWDTLFELDDTDLSAADPPNKSMLIYSGPSSAWKDETVATMMGYADLNDAGTKNHNDLDNIGTDDHHAKYTDAEVEAIITAEIVGGQSIDNAIDALITTHTADDDAHHVKYTDAEAVTAMGVKGDANPLHHDMWTTADTEGVITAEIVGGQSIDNAIDALIATHTAIATAHQDAPALIATHASDVDAHHNHRVSGFDFIVGNGGVLYTGNAFDGFYLPSADNNAYGVARLYVPKTWPGTTGVIHIVCAIEHASNTFSWALTVKSIDEAGEAWAGTTILNADNTHDITGTGVSLAIQVEEVSISSIAAGDVLSLYMKSDASNSNNLYVLGVYMDVT